MSALQKSHSLLDDRAFTLRIGLSLLCASCLGLAGCTTTAPGERVGAASRLKTYLAVGDKPLPVVGGEPGSTVASADDEPTVSTPPARAEGRISGRVYGVDGRPVANARVRLAVSSAPGGKVYRATTDKSGAFTLHGLRPGTTYTVIAESMGNEGFEVGHARARADQTDVRIRLASAPEEGRAAESTKVNVNRVSDREADDDPADQPAAEEPAPTTPARSGSRASHVNEEDLPPAPEAEALAPERSAVQTASADPGWRAGQSGPAPEGDSEEKVERPRRTANRVKTATETVPAEPETAAGPAAPSGPEVESPIDDGPNPLPPALEPEQVSPPSASRAPMPTPSPAPAPGAADPLAPIVPRIVTRDRSADRLTVAGGVSPYDSPSRPTATPSPKPTRPAETVPGALVVTPETFAPIVLGDDPVADQPRRTAARTRSDTAAPSRPRQRSAPAPAPAPEPAPQPAPAPEPEPEPQAQLEKATPSADLPPVSEAPAARKLVTEADPAAVHPEEVERPARPALALASAATPSVSKRHPTWGEVAATASSLPPLEGGSKPAKMVAKSDRAGGKPSAVAAPADDDPIKPLCEYDDRHRRMVDFRLPDLDGKPVRFADIDADLILLDFWGTWCQPCVKSIPHLVDLQAKAAGKRLKVIGIACEPDASDVAARKVAASVAKLKINYPVLLSRNGGSCPLQEALHVQALPTMILLDRQGRVLWRDQGATPATLARLDRMVATATSDATIRR